MKLTHSFLITTSPDKLSVQDERLNVQGVATEIVSGFDFRAYTPVELEKHYEPNAFGIRYGCLPSAGAVGCAAAHRHCYEIIARDGGDCALIIEDDYIPNGNLNLLLAQLIGIRASWDVILLKIVDGVFLRDPVSKQDIGSVFVSTLYNFGTHAYIIKRAAAVKLLDKQTPKIRNLADWPLEAWEFSLLGLHTDLGSLSGRKSTVQSGFRPHRGVVIRLFNKIRKFAWRVRKYYRMQIRKDVVITAT